MSVYVDDGKARLGRMRMSHMVADSLEELHRMARCLGLRQEWFQAKSHPHYDVCQSKKAEAIGRGAIAVTRRELVAIVRQQRETP